jgi:hypothetical protein
MMEGVRIVFRNFRGEKKKYNKEGDRNFAVVLDDATAQMLLEDGWNVKQFKKREDDPPEEEAEFYLPVAVKYGGGRPPRIVTVTSRGRKNLSEDEVEIVDWVEIKNVDMIVRPYNYNVNGKTGIRAYLKSMFITIEEDPLEIKYDEMEVG